MSCSKHIPSAPPLRRGRVAAWPALVRLAALAVALGACTDISTQPRDDRARLSVSAAVAGAAVADAPVAMIGITVSAPDIAPSLAIDLPMSGGLASGTLRVPAGPARIFTARGFDAAGHVTHEGSVTADIERGDNGPLAITTVPRSGQFPVVITFGTASVVVSPSSAALAVPDTVRLAAVVTSRSGQPVAAPTPVWVSSNPAVATVGPSGLVTARAAGQVRIVALFGGGAGVSIVTVSAPPARIAFVSIRGGFREIYVMNADGTGQTRLTNGRGGDFYPAWSPDRTRIAFMSARDAYYTSNTEIYAMSADGTTQKRLTDNHDWDGEPSWSPDGARIAFGCWRGGNYEICVMNPDGSGETRLTHSWAVESKRAPSWSPDGARIAYSSDGFGNDDIYVMNADGTSQTRLTNDPGNDNRPAWSPDGGRIAFVSRRDGNPEIYLMNADGTGVKRLTNSPGSDESPSWSPDGTRIAFESDRDGNAEIYVMNADGTGVTRLTVNSMLDETPAWW